MSSMDLVQLRERVGVEIMVVTCSMDPLRRLIVSRWDETGRLLFGIGAQGSSTLEISVAREDLEAVIDGLRALSAPR